MKRPLRKLSARHKQAARLLVSGYSQREVSERIGMSEAHLSVVVSSPPFQEEVKRLEGELNQCVIKAQNILIEAAPDAAQVKVDILKNTESERLKSDVASDILKGVGALRTEKTEPPNMTLNISQERWDLIITTLKEVEEAKSQKDDTNTNGQ